MLTSQEPGEYAHPKGGYVPGMFSRVETADDFAQVLCVPKKSIALITPLKDTICRSRGCQFQAIMGNNKYCPAHRRAWYPLKGVMGARGEWLLGPEFLRSSNEGRLRYCSCNEQSCERAGYFPGQGALFVKKEWAAKMLSTPNLFESETVLKYKNDPDLKMYLYPWHFFADHRERDEHGYWRLIEFGAGKKYYDSDRVPYSYPPPRNSVKHFLENEYFTNSYVRPQDRWAEENTKSKMPNWMIDIMVKDGSHVDAPPKQLSSTQLLCEIDMWKQRALSEKQQREQEGANLRKQLAGTKRKYNDLSTLTESELAKEREKTAKAVDQLSKVQRELAEAKTTLERLAKEKGRALKYDDLYEGGFLSKHVEAFTFFHTVKQNDEFLKLLNYADGTDGAHPEGDGLCENLRRYEDVDWAERKRLKDPPSDDPESKEYKSYLNRSRGQRKRGGRSWKDDYLSFCLYIRAGLTETAAATLSGIETKRMSGVLYEWANVLDDALCEMFPRPSREQMLRAYPERLVEADGHARCFMLLDAFEIFAQSSSNPNVSSSEHSDYKKHTTIKFLGGTDPIGCAWKETVPDGNPGKASDVMMTADTHILRQIPFGHTCKVDKGFIVDNEAAQEGVFLDRPQKRRKKQVQQSSVDTSQTQKLGNTRITVENVNGELKGGVRYLNAHIPVSQFSIISKIVRIGYLMQNFKKGIIQNREPSMSEGYGRPCRAEIRWYNGTDKGLMDARDNVRLWGLRSEIKLHAELSSKEENKGKSHAEISRDVINKNLNLTRRQELYRAHHGIEYDGTHY